MKKSGMKECKKKLSDVRDQKNFVRIIFVVMLIVQLGNIIYSFQFKKEGWHSDEIWSYGYANSFYQKNVHLDEENTPMNVNEWVDGKVFRDYIIVNNGQQFRFDSVYHNQIYDLSPPLHSIILHAICSFFPETFSFWYGFVINIVSFIVCMICLFKGARILKGDLFALCCCAVYGFSLGARDTYIYLRMYGMCAAFVAAILYYLLSYMKQSRQDGKNVNKYLVALCITAYLSFLTHYYMVSIVGLITFFVCIWMLFQKKIKQLFIYGFSMLFVLGLSIVTYPSLIIMSRNKSVAAVERSHEMLNYNFEMRFRILLNAITMKLYNIPVSIYRSNWHQIAIACLIYLLVLSIPLLILCRNTRIVQRGKKTISFVVKHMKSIARYLFRRVNGIYIVLFLVIIFQIIVVGETSDVAGMGVYQDRYLFNVYPLAVIVGLAGVFQVGVILLRKKRYCNYLMFFITLLLCGFNIYNQKKYNDYLFPMGVEGADIKECLEGASCIYVEKIDWFSTTMVPILMNTNCSFRVAPKNCDIYKEEYMKKLQNEKVVLLVDCDFKYRLDETLEEAGDIRIEDFARRDKAKISQEYKDVIDFFENIEPSSKMKKVSEFTIFERPFEVYIINP